MVIHLSDLHLKPNENPALERKDLISKAFQNLSLEADISFMVISGDIASSGKEDEYFQAIEFIDSIRDHIQKYSKKELNCLIVPGNHDCDHQLDKNIIRELHKRWVVADKIKHLKKRYDLKTIDTARMQEMKIKHLSFARQYNVSGEVVVNVFKVIVNETIKFIRMKDGKQKK